MTRTLLYLISLLCVFMLAGCTDDELTPGLNGDGTPISPLRFEVTPFSVNVDGVTRSAQESDNPEQENEKERRIRDFWLFQFNLDGTQLAAPKYYSMPDNGATLNDLTLAAYNDLTKDTPMMIYVVTNTGSSTWATGAGFDTIDKVKEQKLPMPSPIQAGVDHNNDGVTDDNVYIPMFGGLDNVTVKNGGIVVLPVTRMYAKIKIQVGFNDPTMNFYYADVKGIPWYCKVTTVSTGIDPATGEPAAVDLQLPASRWVSRAFNSTQTETDASGNKWLVLYMPENLRGEVSNANKATSENIPDNALKVIVSAKYDGADYFYTVYPGENNVNNFNVRRNCVYRVNIAVRNFTDQHNPSSNCFVVGSYQKLSFEPYNRVEKGGGYDISTYLNPNDPKKRIAKVDIIWQTLDCIGDNTDGNLVHYVASTDPEHPEYSKIRIEHTGYEGNALVGAYNSDNEIIWSWHIWVTPNQPDNIANAVVYTTYHWDSGGIYNTEPRVPGYGIMPCNLGALSFSSDEELPLYPRDNDIMKVSGYSIPVGERYPESHVRTFGMLYQWGRKDPFPPVVCSTGTEDKNGTLPYTNAITDLHYANDNQTIVEKTSEYDATDYLFHSTVLLKDEGNIFRPKYTNSENPVQYGIAHPTVYISGCLPSRYGAPSTSAFNKSDGDWCGTDADASWGLWGATEDTSVSYNVVSGQYIYDNYGEKSIFDPCPNGWRVPPGDLWLGFTSTGLNPSSFDEVNYAYEESELRPGMSMFVQGWHTGPKTYFPLQGTLQYNGIAQNPGLCGNYHNATCFELHKVNILHLHRNMDKASGWNVGTGRNMLFRIFETSAANTSKSTASPVRCVRDSR